LYANNGTIIRTCKGRIRIEDKEGSVNFKVHGKAFKISGTFVVENDNIEHNN